VTAPAPAPWTPGDPDPTPQLQDPAAYCWAVRYPAGVGRARWCTWAAGPEHPDWHVAADTRGRVTDVWPTSQEPLPAGVHLSPADVPPLGPQGEETADSWTDRLARTGSTLGINRQCSIGWHAECSDRAADQEDPDTCRCACHVLTPELPGPLWVGPDQGDGEGPVVLQPYGTAVHLETDSTSLLDLTEHSAAGLGLALLAWARQQSTPPAGSPDPWQLPPPYAVGDPDPTPQLDKAPVGRRYCHAASPGAPTPEHDWCTWLEGEDHPAWHVAGGTDGTVHAVWAVLPF